MVVVFDEESAREKTAKFKRRKRILNDAFMIFSAVACCGGILLMVSANNLAGWLFMLLSAMVLLCSFVQHWAAKEYRAAPEPIVAYWMAIQERRVLEVKAEDASVSWEKRMAVSVVTEGLLHGLVDKTWVGVLKRVENTRVREVTVDLNEGVVYVPYKSTAKDKEKRV